MARKSVRDLPGANAVRKPASAARKAASTATKQASTATKQVEDLSPTSHLQQSLQSLAGTVAERALSGVTDKVSGTADRLTRYADGDGGGNLLSALTGVEKLAQGSSPMKAAMSAGMTHLGHSVQEKFQGVKESLTGGKGKGGGGKKLKLTNIVEHIDVGVPIQLAYDQWTQFADFPKFMKKLEQVEQVSDEKLNWTGKVFWSRRSWESTIVEQVPYERIIWRSKGAKGYIDGAVTFHELTPDLTRIIMVLEYHPVGVFEKTANLWRAAGRRTRLELKHFQRHVMTDALLHPDDIEGWHGEIRDKKVVAADGEDETSGDETGEDETSGDETSGEETADDETGTDRKGGDRKGGDRRAEGRSTDDKGTRRKSAARGSADEDDEAGGTSERAVPRRKPAAGRRSASERSTSERPTRERRDTARRSSTERRGARS